MSDDSFVEHVLDLLSSAGPVRARPMMGGHVVHCGDLSIALIADERLYLKVDGQTKEEFKAAGGEPFTYEMRGKQYEMSYWTTSDDAMDNPETMRRWATLALEAAARFRRSKQSKKPGKAEKAEKPRRVGVGRKRNK